MSHDATNWAIQRRGLKPTTKIVLWHAKGAAVAGAKQPRVVSIGQTLQFLPSPRGPAAQTCQKTKSGRAE